MGTFGEKLQREREMRGITLEEIAEATKIGTRSLRALEEQDFDKLPGGIFNKGFVRAYSRYLGIDEDQAVADYMAAVSDAQATGKIQRPELATPIALEEEKPPAPVQMPWKYLIAAALLVAFVFSARSYYAKAPWLKLRRAPAAAQEKEKKNTLPAGVQPAGTPPAAATSGMQAAAPPAPVPTAANAAKAAPAPEGFVVKIHALEVAWVEIQVDGKTLPGENLTANTERVIPAAQEVVIKTGNAGGIELRQNDKLLPPLGPKDVVRTVKLTAKGME